MRVVSSKFQLDIWCVYRAELGSIVFLETSNRFGKCHVIVLKLKYFTGPGS